jgi:hypothetical protein
MFQDYYLAILNKYINGRYGNIKAAVLYPKLLSKMADLRELSDCHQEQNLMLARHEVKTMKLELNRIQQPETYFEPPQKFFVGQDHQLIPESISPTGIQTGTSPQDYSVASPQQSEPVLIPTHSYSTLPSVSSPCDSIVSSSSSSQRFFPQTPPFSESISSDEFYVQMGSYDGKEQDQFMPSFLCLQTPTDMEVVRISDCISSRPQEFQQYCLPVDQKSK